MAKAVSKYISFDSEGQLVSGPVDEHAPEVVAEPESASLKAAVAYALDTIVEAAGALPENAAALIASRAAQEDRKSVV